MKTQNCQRYNLLAIAIKYFRVKRIGFALKKMSIYKKRKSDSEKLEIKGSKNWIDRTSRYAIYRWRRYNINNKFHRLKITEAMKFRNVHLINGAFLCWMNKSVSKNRVNSEKVVKIYRKRLLSRVILEWRKRIIKKNLKRVQTNLIKNFKCELKLSQYFMKWKKRMQNRIVYLRKLSNQFTNRFEKRIFNKWRKIIEDMKTSRMMVEEGMKYNEIKLKKYSIKVLKEFNTRMKNEEKKFEFAVVEIENIKIIQLFQKLKENKEMKRSYKSILQRSDTIYNKSLKRRYIYILYNKCIINKVVCYLESKHNQRKCKEKFNSWKERIYIRRNSKVLENKSILFYNEKRSRELLKCLYEKIKRNQEIKNIFKKSDKFYYRKATERYLEALNENRKYENRLFDFERDISKIINKSKEKFFFRRWRKQKNQVKYKRTKLVAISLLEKYHLIKRIFSKWSCFTKYNSNIKILESVFLWKNNCPLLKRYIELWKRLLQKRINSKKIVLDRLLKYKVNKCNERELLRDGAIIYIENLKYRYLKRLKIYKIIKKEMIEMKLLSRLYHNNKIKESYFKLWKAL